MEKIPLFAIMVKITFVCNRSLKIILATMGQWLKYLCLKQQLK